MRTEKVARKMQAVSSLAKTEIRRVELTRETSKSLNVDFINTGRLRIGGSVKFQSVPNDR